MVQELKYASDRSVKVEVGDNQTPEELLQTVYDKLDSMTEKELNEFLEYQKRQQQSSDLLTVVELPWN